MAESIKVALELDDRQYTGKLQTAIDNTKKLGDTGEAAAIKASSGFSKLASSAEMAAGKIKTLLVAVAGLEAIKGALALGDELSDLSKATDISIQKIIQLQGALQTAGGNGEDAGRMISQLVNTLDSAAQGGSDAQDQLFRLGFSLKDITNLSPEQALEKTVAALAKMTNPIERNALAFQLLGKSARNINWDEVNQKIGENAEKYDEAAAAALKAGELFDRLAESAKNAKIGLMIAIEPLADLVDLLGKLAGGSNGGFVQALAFAFKALSIGVATIAGAFKGIIIDIKTLIDLAPAVWARDWDKAGQIIENRNKEVAKTFDDLAGYIQQQDLFGTGAGAGRGKVNPAVVKPGGGGAGNAPPAKLGLQGEIDAILNIAEAYAKANARAREKLQLDYNLAGSSEEYKKMTEESTRITNEATDKIQQLQDKLKGLSDKQKRAGEAGAIQKTIRAIEEDRDKSIAAAQAIIAQNEERIRTINDIKNAYDAMIQSSMAGNEQFLAAQQKMKDIEDARRQSTMGPLAKALDQIRVEEEKLADAARKRELATGKYTNAEGEVTQAEALAQAYGLIDQQMQKNIKTRQDQTEQIIKEQSTFGYGWEEAFRKYSESAFNAADQAKTIFETFTKGFEDAMVRFAQTGKLSFKDLANSIIADIIRIQAKKIALGLFGESGGTGGILGGMFSGIGGFISGLFKAGGGPVGANSPYIVGERGPELFVPRTAGNIIPNNQLAMGSAAGGSMITYNINAVDAASFKSLVARDPQFIYQVTEKGRRSQPTRSRA